jgi:hypothetical protein
LGDVLRRRKDANGYVHGANKNIKRDKVEALASRFEIALSNVVTVFGEHSFQRWQPERNGWRNQVLASLYDAEMLAIQNINNELLSEKKEEIVTRFRQLFGEAEFLR